MSKKYKGFLWIFIFLVIIGVSIFYLLRQYDNQQANNTKLIQNNETKANEGVSDKPQINKKKEREFAGVNIKYNDRSLPVLMYHSIAYEEGNELRIPKENFREQMKYLKDNNYTTLTLDELYSFFISNKPIQEKSVVITFDDGYKDNYENAYPILKEFGFNATIFVITGAIDNEKDYLTLNQLKEMEQNGIDIESHTVAHEQLDKISYEKQLDTITRSKKYLEEALGKEIRYIAYPFGKYNTDTVKASKYAGYNMSFTTQGGWSNKTQDIFTLNRVYISANYGLSEFKRRLTNPNYNTN
ncbi:polysaccharide deacetylase family protein [Clostridium sp. CX1]|uniref:polysaccharide deacetylase family protein n=1 Tax=Clostridium sp. CX1 TaxID=2978346 RepID=UPI0021C11F8E|nr:polysaccharide deacetylase family protein [Clostridium sp. CX1]MCT8975711.1 polysaccharide deacetylase family protein [Clostridium sp. CX1]